MTAKLSKTRDTIWWTQF